jgi:hypothetical protein
MDGVKSGNKLADNSKDVAATGRVKRASNRDGSRYR